MNRWDLIKMGFHNLWRKKTRTFLTVLGVIIGTCSIVVMISIGLAMDKGNKEWIESMGNLNIIKVRGSGGYYGDGPKNQQAHLNDKAILQFKEIPGVEAVMPSISSYMKIGAGRMVGEVDIKGIDPKVMEAFDFKVEEGRLLNELDKDALIFGKEVAFDFYNPRLNRRNYGRNSEEPPVNLISNKLILTSNMDYGEKRRNRQHEEDDYKPPSPHKVKGVGILEETGDEKDWSAYMNIEFLKKIIKEDEKSNTDRRRSRSNEDPYEKIEVKAKDIEQVQDIQEKIKKMGFEARSLTDMLKRMEEQSKKMQAILGGIGAVSLLVAAIGITNTMIMSIYERTREIGVMKVLGANLGDIKKLFLIEAAMIGFCGGLLGLLLSYAISFGLNQMGTGFMGIGSMETGLSIIPVRLAVSGVLFATFIGVISGYLPARRAMNLSALKAIKTE